MELDLVFEGGGAKGLAFVGALQAIERHGHTVKRVIGTSAGSITAMLVAAGYNAEECLAAINERTADDESRFTTFLETPQIDERSELSEGLRSWVLTEQDNPLIPNLIEPFVDGIIAGLLKKDLAQHILSFLLYGGWYAGDRMMVYFAEKLDAGGRDLGGTTLKEFYDRTGRSLSVVASDTTGREMLTLNHRTAPDCPTIWAVRMSMSCPLVWQEVKWRKEWGKYLGRDLAGHTVVDGGLLSNFPIRLFLSEAEDVREVMGENTTPEAVVGLLLDDEASVPGAAETQRGQEKRAPGFLERSDLVALMTARLSGIAETTLNAHDISVIDAHAQLVCRLPAKEYGILEFDLTPERTAPILRAGVEAMETHLNKRGL